MALYKIQMKDAQGNTLNPQTLASLVQGLFEFISGHTSITKLEALIGTKKDGNKAATGIYKDIDDLNAAVKAAESEVAETADTEELKGNPKVTTSTDSNGKTTYTLAGGILYSIIPKIAEDDLTQMDFVDLGLPSGKKWASCNLGATSPCKYGFYYQWGSITPNNDTICDWAHAPFNGGASDYDADYFNAHKSEWLNGDVLKPEYDAAYQATDGKAHIPTREEWSELLNNTTSQWCQCTVLGEGHTDHTINGRLFVSNQNNKSIFIPAVGYRDGASFYNRGSSAFVWSSSLYASNPYSAFKLYFLSDI